MRSGLPILYLKRVLAALALLPFVVLTLIPAQVMPGRAADGTLTMVLCADGIEEAVTVDLATGLPVDTAPPDGDGRCDWAAGHWTFADLVAMTLHLPVKAARPTALPIKTTVLHYAIATGLPPATGPPALI